MYVPADHLSEDKLNSLVPVEDNSGQDDIAADCWDPKVFELAGLAEKSDQDHHRLGTWEEVERVMTM